MVSELNKKKTGSVGGILGIIIVILVLLLGAYYFWQNKIERRLNSKESTIDSTSTTTISSVNIQTSATST